jgi:hypothetical protein
MRALKATQSIQNFYARRDLNGFDGPRLFCGETLWLFSRRADFWFAAGGASAALLLALLVIGWHEEREADWLDFVLGELHLGATYGAIIRRRLWRQRQVDVLIVPFVILAFRYRTPIGPRSNIQPGRFSLDVIIVSEDSPTAI